MNYEQEIPKRNLYYKGTYLISKAEKEESKGIMNTKTLKEIYIFYNIKTI